MPFLSALARNKTQTALSMIWTCNPIPYDDDRYSKYSSNKSVFDKIIQLFRNVQNGTV